MDIDLEFFNLQELDSQNDSLVFPENDRTVIFDDSLNDADISNDAATFDERTQQTYSKIIITTENFAEKKGLLELRTLNKKAQCWTYFGVMCAKETSQVVENVKGKVFCKECFDAGKFQSYSLSTATTNLISHLEKHRITVVKTNAAKVNGFMDESLFGNEIQAITQQCLGARIALWFCRALLPFATVVNDGFTDFWHGLKTNLTLPKSRSSVSGTHLSNVFNCFKRQLLRVLTGMLILKFISFFIYNVLMTFSEHSDIPNDIIIALDAWTDSYKRRSYITYVLHYIDKNWNMQTHVLKTTIFENRHTSDNIKEHLNATLVEFGLNEKRIVYVTDGGSNVVAACRGIFYQPCIAHKIHRLIMHNLLKNDEMEELVELLNKMKKTQRKIIFEQEKLRKHIEFSKNCKDLELLLNHLHSIGMLFKMFWDFKQ